MIDEHLDYNVTAKHVSQCAHRALGLLISKDKAQGGFQYDIFTSLYDSMVSSIIDYGSAIWGHSSFSCIEAVQNRASRYFLGLGPRAPNRAVQGDIGWKLQDDRQFTCIVRQWLRNCNMEDSRLSKKVFAWAVMKASLGLKNRYYKIIERLKQYNLDYLIDVNTNVMFKDIKSELASIMVKKTSERWLDDVNRCHSKSGKGGNKLRTYKLFKSNLEPECYVHMNIKKKYRRALAMFRTGVAPINIELLRYGEGKKLEDRKCIHCADAIETECHVLTTCPLYVDLRTELYESINDILFQTLNDEQKMCYMLSNSECVYNVARTCYEILERRKFLTYV